MLAGQDQTSDKVVVGAADAERALFARVRDGDLRAFEALYRIYRPRLMRFLLGLVGRRPLAEEALDDTMMVVWERPDAYKGESKLSTWIFAIAYRKALKALNRQDLPVEEPAVDLRQTEEPAADRLIERQQSRTRLLRALQELSPEHRAVVDLTYFHELGYREIAEIVGCPPETVKTRMFYARRHLRLRLDGVMADWL